MVSDPVTDFTQGRRGASATVGGRDDALVADEECVGGGAGAKDKGSWVCVTALLVERGRPSSEELPTGRGRDAAAADQLLYIRG